MPHHGGLTPLAYCIITVVGTVMLVAPFHGIRRHAPRWVRLTLGTIGFLCLLWGLLVYTEEHLFQHFSPSALRLLVRGGDLCAGAILGAIFLLVAAGGFLQAFPARKPTA